MKQKLISTAGLVAAIGLFVLTCVWSIQANGMERHLYIDYTRNEDAILERKAELMAIADSSRNYWYCGDRELEEQDPHAYWLMNRMMQMMSAIRTADDCWGWMLAMKEYIQEYNARLGRKIGSLDAACNAIKDLITIYGAGNQPEMNTATYVRSILAHFKAVNSYYELIEFIDDYDLDSDWDMNLRELYYREFEAWFDLNNAANGIMYYYTYAAASYSALPMELNGTFRVWSESRLKELEIEDELHWKYDWEKFSSKAKKVSIKKFNKLVNYFKTRTKADVIEEYFDRFYSKKDRDYEYAEDRVGCRYDFEKIAEMVTYYESALAEWREVRDQITLMQSKEKQKSYREVTKQIHTRLYNDLLDLKTIHY